MLRKRIKRRNYGGQSDPKPKLLLKIKRY